MSEGLGRVAELAARLQSYYRSRDGGDASRVANVSPLAAGWESDICGFALETGGRMEDLVIRRYHGSPGAQKAQHEFRVLERLYELDFPVPRVRDLELNPTWVELPFITMEWIRGEMMWPLLRDPHRDQEALLDQFCGLLARLHALEWDDPTGRETRDTSSSSPIDQGLSRMREVLAQFPDIGLEPALDWLDGHRKEVAALPSAPLHWDMHPGNVMVRADGSAVVLDWTSFEISDPRFDLAWTLVLVSTQDPQLTRDRLLAGYERAAGARLEATEFFEVFACLRRLGAAAISLAYGPEALGMRAEAAAAMRRNMAAFHRVYAIYLERTSTPLAAVERFLAE